MRKLIFSVILALSVSGFAAEEHDKDVSEKDSTLARPAPGQSINQVADFNKVATSLKNWGGGNITTKKDIVWDGTTAKIYPTSAQLKEAGQLIEKIKTATDKMEKDCGSDPSAKLAAGLFKQCFANGGLGRAVTGTGVPSPGKVEGDRWELALNGPEFSQCRAESDKYFNWLRTKVGKTQTNWQLEKDINKLYELTWAAKTPKEAQTDAEKKWVSVVKDQSLAVKSALDPVAQGSVCKVPLAAASGGGSFAAPPPGGGRGAWGGSSMCGGKPCGGSYSQQPYGGAGYGQGYQYQPGNYSYPYDQYQPKGYGYGGLGGGYQPQNYQPTQPYGGGGGGGYPPPVQPAPVISGGGFKQPYPPFFPPRGGGGGGFMPIIPPSGGGVGCGGLCTVAQPMPLPKVGVEVKATTTPIPAIPPFNPLALFNPCLGIMGAANGMSAGMPSLFGQTIGANPMMPIANGMLQGAQNLMNPMTRINPLCFNRFQPPFQQPFPQPMPRPIPPPWVQPGLPRGPIVTPNPNPGGPIVTPVNPNNPNNPNPVNPNVPSNQVGNIGRDSGSVPRGTGLIN